MTAMSQRNKKITTRKKTKTYDYNVTKKQKDNNKKNTANK